MRDRFIKLPRTSTRNCPQSFAKLLTRVDPAARRGGFFGTLIRPGSVVGETALWPTPEHPAIPVLLECAGVAAGKGARGGHHREPCLWLLWRFDPDCREWVELGRAFANDWQWEESLRPLAVRALTQGQPERILPDLAAVCDRLMAAIHAELKALLIEEQAHVLATLEHEVSALYVSLDPR